MKDIIVMLTNFQDEKIQEMRELVKANNENIVDEFRQDVKSIDFRTYIGKGKVDEIKTSLEKNNAVKVQFDIDLSPLQIRNLEETLEVSVRDRSELILEIFETRAQTKVARLQIESAKLKKLLPRLVGANTQLSRQGSGKNKGAGEKQLEIDRRRVKARIHEVQKELKDVKRERMTQRKRRSKQQISLVSLVGYTNAGKSTIMNQMLSISKQKEEKQVLQKDMLFATLDTAVRKIIIGDHRDFLLSDTVGFVSDLPHTLVEAFHSTLEEITYADLLIQVIDASSDNYEMQMQTTSETLKSIDAAHIPMLTIYNKCDHSIYDHPQIFHDKAYISALNDEEIKCLISMIQDALYPNHKWLELYIPYENSSLFSYLLQITQVKDINQEIDGVRCIALLDIHKEHQFAPYVTKHIEKFEN